MRLDILLSILFELLERGKVTAPALANKHGVSVRTLYRYVRALSPYLPLRIARGRQGGVFLDDRFRLPCNFFSESEFSALSSALTLAYSQSGDEEYLRAKRKLNASRSPQMEYSPR